MGRALSLLFLTASAIGCARTAPEPAKAPGEQAAAAGELSGTVQERLAASPYVYLRIKTGKGDIWAAVPEAAVEVGAQVTVYNPMLMSGFESQTLKRTFDEVYFGSLAPVTAAGPGGDPHAGVQAPAAVNVGTVAKATGPDAYTVAEVLARKENLEGKTVSIRGVVVKYNEGVMGKNWLHLQDGSGDITVTSLDGAARGETVTIRGTVRTNRDFGAGYSYAVIVEDAKVSKQ